MSNVVQLYDFGASNFNSSRWYSGVAMRDFSAVLVLFSAVAAIVMGGLIYLSRKALTSTREELKRTRANVSETRTQLNEIVLQKKQTDKNYQQLSTILSETSSFYPSLAQAIADFRALEGERLAAGLSRKSRPAYKSAQIARDAVSDMREAEKRFHVLKYQLAYYEATFPWLVEFAGRSSKDLLDELERRRGGARDRSNAKGGDDEVRRWLTDEEWSRLSSAERSDLALVRWGESGKSSWQIGREYERSIGYMYEQDGFRVEYVGAVKGFEDMGRALIAKKEGIIHLVQCKYWRQERTVREKHVFQLIGTALEYACTMTSRQISNLDLAALGITPVLVTSTSLSETARRCARLTNVIVKEQQIFQPYPLIKCNINSRTGEHIYHLPFDQQYDTTRIDLAKRECYAATAMEAEAKGFRRAKRYKGSAIA
jgi:hypothetical protein